MAALAEELRLRLFLSWAHRISRGLRRLRIDIPADLDDPANGELLRGGAGVGCTDGTVACMHNCRCTAATPKAYRLLLPAPSIVSAHRAVHPSAPPAAVLLTDLSSVLGQAAPSLQLLNLKCRYSLDAARVLPPLLQSQLRALTELELVAEDRMQGGPTCSRTGLARSSRRWLSGAGGGSLGVCRAFMLGPR